MLVRAYCHYTVGLFGPNGGVPDERFVRTLHRLYGVAFTRDVLFPAVLEGLRGHRFQYDPTWQSRLVVLMPTSRGQPTVAEVRESLVADGWLVSDLILVNPTRFFRLATLTHAYAGMQLPHANAAFPADWKLTHDPEVAQHVHDALLAGLPFSQIPRPPVRVVDTTRPIDTVVPTPV